MPLNIDLLQILLHMLNFVILAGGLTFLLFKPVNKFLEKRRAYFAEIEEKNRQDSEKNEELRIEYEKKLRDAEAEILEKKRISEKEQAEISDQYIKEAKEKATAIIQAAENEAEERKNHILESAQTEIGELVLTAAQKLVSNTVTPERNSDLYDEFIRLAEKDMSDERSANNGN